MSGMRFEYVGDTVNYNQIWDIEFFCLSQYARKYMCTHFWESDESISIQQGERDGKEEDNREGRKQEVNDKTHFQFKLLSVA